MLRRCVLRPPICRTNSLSFELAPYRTGAQYLHDYYSVSSQLMKVWHRQTFIQMDPDHDTERFLSFSRKQSRQLKYKFILPYFHQRKDIRKSYAKWDIGSVSLPYKYSDISFLLKGIIEALYEIYTFL